jgi:hypothetical protein
MDNHGENSSRINDPSIDVPRRGSKKTISRRRFFKGAFVAAGLATAAGGLYESAKNPPRLEKTSYTHLSEIPIASPMDISPFQPPRELMNLPFAEGWSEQNLLEIVHRGIGEALATGEQVIVELPEGEIQIANRLDITIPEGAKIVLKGHEKGSRLKLANSLSDIPEEWGSFGEYNMIYFKDMDGELTIDGIEFHGGSERAGKGGYKAPKSPWDSVIFIVGSGEGSTSDQDAVMKKAGKRGGKVEVRNCNFQNSESGGLVVQNISDVIVADCEGKNLDALLNASWCDDLFVKNLHGVGFNSDGLYITNVQNVILEDLQIMTARQAYDLQGNLDATLRRCNAYDCAIAYNVTKSQTDGTVSGNAQIGDCDSSECVSIYSFGGVQDIAVENGKHYAGGEWQGKFYDKEFFHADGIEEPEVAAKYNMFSLYDLAGGNHERVKFSNVQVYISKAYSVSSAFPQLDGVSYTREK